MTDSEQDWPAGLAASIGKQVSALRKKRGLSAQQLAEVLKSQVGVDMKRPVINALERGDRKSVGITEVMALAYALRVSPLLLVFPVGKVQDLEVLPGVITDTWSAAKWFTGEDLFPGRHVDDDESAWREKRDTALALQLYRVHDAQLEQREYKTRELWKARAEAEQFADNPALRTAVRIVENELHDIEERVGRLRDDMRREQVTPPPLSDDLQHMDTWRRSPRPHMLPGSGIPNERAQRIVDDFQTWAQRDEEEQ